MKMKFDLETYLKRCEVLGFPEEHVERSVKVWATWADGMEVDIHDDLDMGEVSNSKGRKAIIHRHWCVPIEEKKMRFDRDLMFSVLSLEDRAILARLDDKRLNETGSTDTRWYNRCHMKEVTFDKNRFGGVYVLADPDTPGYRLFTFKEEWCREC